MLDSIAYFSRIAGVLSWIEVGDNIVTSCVWSGRFAERRMQIVDVLESKFLTLPERSRFTYISFHKSPNNIVLRPLEQVYDERYVLTAATSRWSQATRFSISSMPREMLRASSIWVCSGSKNVL